ncbi:RNA-binding protein RO60-like [Mercenaria mercenaria]|uniref:RNA-binding protein RO60-like n=1 Tax=Mercenaria mercenaria TaxID=6596 RepID=UPI00234F7D00|nr:RNA-binding protein RO60-like [Mercenaria mercenaria]
MKRLLRFIIIGSERTYYAREKELERENARCIDRLIKANRGAEVLQTIKDISISRRNVRQNSLLLAYAICARSNDSDTKSAAYALMSEICRIPTHLFMFIKYCEEVSKDERPDTGTGWGRAHKRAIGNWYTNFEKNPEKLARLITKFKNRENWCHKDVLRLSHTCTEDQVMAFIFSYIINGYEKAMAKFRQTVLEMSQEEASKFRKISGLIKVFDDAARCGDANNLCAMIKEHKLAWEQCNQNLRNKKEIWCALLPHMPPEALIRNLGKMTSYGMFAENSEDEQEALDKIRSINVPRDAADQEPRERSVEGNEDIEDERPWLSRNSYRNFLHPLRIFFAWIIYKTGHGDRGNSTWGPNTRITNALEKAFYRGYTAVEPTGQTFYLAVSVSPSMSRHIFKSRTVTCSMAAATMLMLTARTEENCIIKAFGQRTEDLDISPTDTLEQVEHKMRNAQHGQPTDCAEPIKDAIDMQRKDIDVFVIYTDSETCIGNVHPYQALCEYRKYSANPRVKMVVCGMCATDLTIADKEDQYMLDIAGFDSNAPWIISEFARGQL